MKKKIRGDNSEKEAVARVNDAPPRLRELREKQGLSQRAFSEKAGISRGRLRRLEGAHFEEITYAELKQISLALGKGMREIFQEEIPFANGLYVGRACEIPFQLDRSALGYKITSFTPLRRDLFVGKVFLAGGKILSGAQAPQAQTIFLQMLLGELRVETGEEIHEIREGDRIVFHGEIPYILKNPTQRDSVALLATVPAFATQ